MTSKQPSVRSCATKYLKCGKKRQDICWWSGNSVKRKTTPGQSNPEIPLSKDKASYKALVLTKPIVVVIPLTVTQSQSWTLPNQVSYLKGSLMDSFTLGSTPKIDFTRTVEHTPVTAWELADLQFSLNTLSNHYLCWILKFNKPRSLYI